MKDYLIFLKSGECIQGTIDESTANALLDDFMHMSHGKSKYEDKNGVFAIDFTEVSSVCLNAQEEESTKIKIGF